MRILLIDDEKPARAELRFVLEELLEDAEFDEASNAESAEELLRTNEYRIIFLDINLGEVNGILLASLIKEKQKNAAIVFVTAYQEYAVKAFELEAVDYILKPFDANRIRKTLHRLEELHYFAQKEAEESGTDIRKLPVHAGEKILLIDFDDIIYIEYNNRNSLIRTAHAEYMENYSMAYLESRLGNERFFRIHKSFLVNLNKVEELVLEVNNSYGMRMKGCGDRLLPISRGSMKQLKHLLAM